MSLSIFRPFLFDWLGSWKEGRKKKIPIASQKRKGLATRCWVRQAKGGLALYSVFILQIPTKFPWFRWVTPIFNCVWFLPFQRPSGVYSLQTINFRSTELGRVGVFPQACEVGERIQGSSCFLNSCQPIPLCFQAFILVPHLQCRVFCCCQFHAF